MHFLVISILCYLLWAFPNVALANNVDGEQLYRTAGGYGCAVCHGIVAEGANQAGGYIRGANIEMLNASLQEVKPMQPLAGVLNNSDRVELADYLLSLENRPIVEMDYDGLNWSIKAQMLDEHNEADLIIRNHDFQEVTIEIPELGLAPISLRPFGQQHLKLIIPSSLESLGGMAIN